MKDEQDRSRYELGIFSDEGKLEGSFYSWSEARKALAEQYAEDDAHVAECCEEHPDEERATCERCDEGDAPWYEETDEEPGEDG